MDERYNIACIGAGNVASHLLPALHKAGHNIVQVISRSVLSAQSLAIPLDAGFSSDIGSLNPNLDLLLLTVPDHVLPNLIVEVEQFKGIVVHVSGSIPLSSFSNVNYPNGVLYPLQTFTKNRQVDFKNIPIFVEGSDDAVLGILKKIIVSKFTVIK